MLIDDAVLIRRHLVEPAPTKDEFEIFELRQASNEVRHEFAVKTINVTTETDSGRFVRFRFHDGDLVLTVRPPVHTPWIDRHWKLVRPLARQFAAEDLLAHRTDGDGNSGNFTECT